MNNPIRGQPGMGQPMMQQPMMNTAMMPGTPMVGQVQPMMQQPMMQQPQLNWMPQPTSGIAGVPSGLEYLSKLSGMIIHQQHDFSEMFSDIENANVYNIYNDHMQLIYKAAEESNFCARQCCGTSRQFTMRIKENNCREIIRIHRKQAITGFDEEITITSGSTNELFGIIRSKKDAGIMNKGICGRGCLWNYPIYNLYDSKGMLIFELRGPEGGWCGTCCQRDVEYPFMNLLGQKVGGVTKVWEGYMRNRHTNDDKFGLHFPENLCVKLKAALLGAVFLTDFLYYEDKPASDGVNSYD